MNAEVGMRNAEWKRMRKWEDGKRNGKECGSRNAECGMEKNEEMGRWEEEFGSGNAEGGRWKAE